MRTVGLTFEEKKKSNEPKTGENKKGSKSNEPKTGENKKGSKSNEPKTGDENAEVQE